MDVFQKQRRVWRSDLPTTEKVVVQVLLHVMGADPSCYPSQQTIARLSGLTRQHANKVLGALRDRGVIIVGDSPKDGRYPTRSYSINWESPILGVGDDDTSAGLGVIVDDDQMSSSTTQQEQGDKIKKNTQEACVGGDSPEAAPQPRTPAHFLNHPTWDEINRIHRETKPAAPTLRLTEDRRDMLDDLVAAHGEEDVLTGWRWMLTSPHARAAYLREKGHSVDTFLRYGTGYIEAAADPTMWVAVVDGGHEPTPTMDVPDIEKTRQLLEKRRRQGIGGAVN
ncbi:hypothetical protein Pan216_37180 [Planctomycetes bacterium Pan216]|uniref:HTH marR-type domain-containing protein n=1 Tax=Kolteria novifilia TaxID=2527975 RepID=A0A518B7A7_9BACT|nr:hypothetical protein Pan216_37180 [Planctomycetes bacterium Pan216]